MASDRQSIGTRLRGRLSAALVILLLACALAMLVAMRFWMIRQIDSDLDSRARAIGTELGFDQVDGRLEIEHNSPILTQYSGGQDDYFYQIIQRGEVLDGSALPGAELLPGAAELASGSIHKLQLPEGHAGRAIVLELLPELEGEVPPGFKLQPVRIIVARSLEDLSRIQSGLLLGLGLCALLGIVFVNFSVPRILQAGLSPLEDLAGELEMVRLHNLDRRFPDEAVPAELKPVYREFNSLMERLEQAFAREKRLTANMAHELRTPVAEMRTMLELSAKYPQDGELAAGTMREMHAVVLQMQEIVNLLLSLARSESGSQDIRPVQLDLCAEIDRQLGLVGNRLDSADIRLERSLPAALPVMCDETMLVSVLHNLMENAAEYCEPGGRIGVKAWQDGDELHLRICNSCGEFQEADLEHIFDPFWRRESVVEEGGHTGLGLSIAESFTRLMAGRLEASLSAEDGFCMELILPVRTATSD
ncbi:HAMP domain-containing histidine kinase [bacterium]|nr:HAMP domain-containing histidine kinase [bacterium]